LLFELIWKAIDLIAFALPLWSAHQVDAATAEGIQACLMRVIFIRANPVALRVRALHYRLPNRALAYSARFWDGFRIVTPRSRPIDEQLLVKRGTAARITRLRRLRHSS
jgi:hypothetical protein